VLAFSAMVAHTEHASSFRALVGASTLVFERSSLEEAIGSFEFDSCSSSLRSATSENLEDSTFVYGAKQPDSRFDAMKPPGAPQAAEKCTPVAQLKLPEATPDEEVPTPDEEVKPPEEIKPTYDSNSAEQATPTDETKPAGDAKAEDVMLSEETTTTKELLAACRAALAASDCDAESHGARRRLEEASNEAQKLAAQLNARLQAIVDNPALVAEPSGLAEMIGSLEADAKHAHGARKQLEEASNKAQNVTAQLAERLRALTGNSALVTELSVSQLEDLLGADYCHALDSCCEALEASARDAMHAHSALKQLEETSENAQKVAAQLNARLWSLAGHSTLATESSNLGETLVSFEAILPQLASAGSRWGDYHRYLDVPISFVGSVASFTSFASVGSVSVGHDNWTADSFACEICSSNFHVAKRRHHCRKCGKCICKTCSPNRIILDGYEGPQRVCSPCVLDTSVRLQAALERAENAEAINAASADELHEATKATARRLEIELQDTSTKLSATLERAEVAEAKIIHTEQQRQQFEMSVHEREARTADAKMEIREKMHEAKMADACEKLKAAETRNMKFMFKVEEVSGKHAFAEARIKDLQLKVEEAQRAPMATRPNRTLLQSFSLRGKERAASSGDASSR
jgi:hypothetical protein